MKNTKIIIGGTLGVALVAGLIYYFLVYKKKDKKGEKTTDSVKVDNTDELLKGLLRDLSKTIKYKPKVTSPYRPVNTTPVKVAVKPIFNDKAGLNSSQLSLGIRRINKDRKLTNRLVSFGFGVRDSNGLISIIQGKPITHKNNNTFFWQNISEKLKNDLLLLSDDDLLGVPKVVLNNF